MGGSASSDRMSYAESRSALQKAAVSAMSSHLFGLHVSDNFSNASLIGDPLMPQLSALTAMEQPSMCENTSDPIWNVLCDHWQSVIDNGVIENALNICCDRIPVACRSYTTCNGNSATCMQPTCLDEENYLSEYEALVTRAFMDHNLTLTEERRCIFATTAPCQVSSSFVENVEKKIKWLETTNVAAATRISQELDKDGRFMEQKQSAATSTSVVRKRVAGAVAADGGIEVSGGLDGSTRANSPAFVRSKVNHKHGENQANSDIQISADYGDEQHGLRQVQNHKLPRTATRNVAADGVVEVSGGFGDSTRVSSPVIVRNAVRQK